MPKELFTASEAATKLSTTTMDPWEAPGVLVAASADKLPVCFEYTGELLIQSIDDKLEELPPRTFDFRGIVRTLDAPQDGNIGGFGVLVELVEARSLKFTIEDGQTVRGLRLPTEHPHGGRIKPGHSVVCWIEECPDIGAEQFLFHADDLEKLAPALQAPATTLPPAGTKEQLPAPKFQGVTTHSTKGRSNTLRPLIRSAMNECAAPDDNKAVWQSFLSIARTAIKNGDKSVFIEVIEADDGNEAEVKFNEEGNVSSIAYKPFAQRVAALRKLRPVKTI